MTDELIIYIDPGFLDNTGHYINFASNIHAEAQRCGMDIWHYVNNEVSERTAEVFNLRKIFRYKAILKEITDNTTSVQSTGKQVLFSTAKKFLDPARSYVQRHNIKLPIKYPESLDKLQFTIDEYNSGVLTAFETSLVEILDKLLMTDVGSADISMFMYTSHPLYLPIFAKALNEGKYSHLNITAHLSLFYLNLPFCRGEQSDQYENMLKSVSDSLEINDPFGKVVLYADSERTITRYGPSFKREIHLLPIPLCNESNPKSETKLDRKKVVIGSFGYTHVKQGYHLVKQLYDRFSKSREHENVHFIVRHNVQWLTTEMKHIVDSFCAETIRIQHHTKHLPASTYESLISECDIVVIPHSAEEYPCQTSGLFIDCIKRGKIVVVPDHTWMADQLQTYGTGSTFKSGDIDSFVECVIMIVNRIDEYRANAHRNVEEFVAFHSARNLLDTIAENVSRVGKSGGTIDLSLVRCEIVSPQYGDTKERSGVIEISNKFISQFKDRHRGERCVIIGNGPSLMKMDLSFLKNEITFGMNRIYLGFERWRFIPSYYVTVNVLVIKQSHEEILKIPAPKFVSIYGHPHIPHPDGLFFLQPVWGPLFSRDPSQGICEGYTVTYVAMQLAYFMGFKEVILIGVDHSFSTPGNPNQEIVSSGVDPNHFDPNYFGKGVHWQLPDLKNSEVAYRMAKCNFEMAGRRIIDATYEGKLHVFPKADYKKVFFGVHATTSAAPSTNTPEDAIEWRPPKFPMVSVIFSAVGYPGRIWLTARALAGQTYPNVETVFVFQEGTIDESVLADLKQDLSLVAVKVQRGCSAGSMLNAGLKASKGEYIAYVNEGDWYTPDHLAGCAHFIQVHNQFSAVYTRSSEVLPTHNRSRRDKLRKVFTQTKDFDRSKLLVSNLIPLSSVMHKRNVLNTAGYFDEELVEFTKWDFLIRLAHHGDFASLPVESVETLWRPEDHRTVREVREFTKAYEQIYSRYNGDRKLREARSSYLRSVGSNELFSSEFGLVQIPEDLDSHLHDVLEFNEHDDINAALDIIEEKIIPQLRVLSAIGKDKTTESSATRVINAVVATSIAPYNIDKQRVAVASWRNIGFKVISLNCTEEIEKLKHLFTDVTFVNVNRDARPIVGKPLVYFDDVLRGLRESGAQICGIINSDISLHAPGDFITFLGREVGTKGMVIGSRVDVESTEELCGTMYPIGFDYFFFDPSVLDCYTDEEFIIGMPWWDYWAPLVPLVQGVPVKELTPPIGYHTRHDFQWSKQSYDELGKRFGAWINQNKVPIELNDDVIKIHGKNHAQFLAILSYIHDHSAKISYNPSRQKTIKGVHLPPTDINQLAIIEPDLPRRFRLQIFMKQIRSCIERDPSFVSSYLTLAKAYSERRHFNEACNLLLLVGASMYKQKNFLGAKYAYLAYQHTVQEKKLRDANVLEKKEIGIPHGSPAEMNGNQEEFLTMIKLSSAPTNNKSDLLMHEGKSLMSHRRIDELKKWLATARLMIEKDLK